MPIIISLPIDIVEHAAWTILLVVPIFIFILNLAAIDVCIDLTHGDSILILSYPQNIKVFIVHQ